MRTLVITIILAALAYKGVGVVIDTAKVLNKNKTSIEKALR